MKEIKYIAYTFFCLMAVSCSNQLDNDNLTQNILGKWKEITWENKITTKGKITSDVKGSYNSDSLSQYWTFTADSILYKTNISSVMNDTCTYFIHNGKLIIRSKYIQPLMTIKSITHTSLVLSIITSSNESGIYLNELFMTFEKQ